MKTSCSSPTSNQARTPKKLFSMRLGDRGCPSRSRLMWTLTVVLLIAGCELQQAPPETLPVGIPRAAQPVPLSREEARAIEELLELAVKALSNDQLTTPEDGSAYNLYLEVLALEPDNERARRGLERIVERYVELALAAAEQKRYPQGRLMLTRARQVDAAHPAIEPTERQIKLLESAQRERVRLDGEQLRHRANTMQRALEKIGGRAGQPGCRVTIRARSDDEGRWVYQQLNRGAGNVRVRARLTVASPPAVELICFPQSG